ncbi:MAG: HlyD family secretion protein [Hyphomicrobiaceae bacterium]
MRMTFRSMIVLLPLLAALVGVYSVMSVANSNDFQLIPESKRLHERSSMAPPTCEPRDRIFAVGTVEPAGGIMAIGAPTGGTVSQIFVQSNASVREGAPLFQLDARRAQADVRLRQRDLQLAMARLNARHAERAALRQTAKVVQASLEAARSAHEHARQLAEMADGLQNAANISRKEHLLRRFGVAGTAASVAEKEAELREVMTRLAALDPQRDGRAIGVDSAQVARAKAELDIAETELALLTVRAPVAGRVLQLNIRPGEVIAPGSVAPLLMGRDGPMHLRIAVDELDIPRFDAALPGVAHLRGNKEAAFDLKFVRMDPVVIPKKNAANRLGGRIDARVLHVIYEVDTARLLPGQVLDVYLGKPCPSNEVPAKHIAQNGRPVRTD